MKKYTRATKHIPDHFFVGFTEINQLAKPMEYCPVSGQTIKSLIDGTEILIPFALNKNELFLSLLLDGGEVVAPYAIAKQFSEESKLPIKGTSLEKYPENTIYAIHRVMDTTSWPFCLSVEYQVDVPGIQKEFFSDDELNRGCFLGERIVYIIQNGYIHRYKTIPLEEDFTQYEEYNENTQIFFVTALSSNSKIASRCFGFFWNEERALNAIRNNEGGMQESLFDYLVLEKGGAGIHPDLEKVSWYEWLDAGWVKIDEPEEFESTVNFALG